MPKKAFLICPVRGHDRSESLHIVRELEIKGWSVYYPPDDTDQDDPTGYRICQDNLRAIKEADVVYVKWDGKSQGCLFDCGIAWALGKPIVVVELPPLTGRKSFQDMIADWGRRHEGS